MSKVELIEVANEDLVIGNKYYFDKIGNDINSGKLMLIDKERDIIAFKANKKTQYVVSGFGDTKGYVCFVYSDSLPFNRAKTKKELKNEN